MSTTKRFGRHRRKIYAAQYATVVVVFPQAPFRATNVPGQASAGIIQLRNCTMAS